MVWACTNCGTNNKDTVNECIVCGAAKPERTASSQSSQSSRSSRRKPTAESEPDSFRKGGDVGRDSGSIHKGGDVSRDSDSIHKGGDVGRDSDSIHKGGVSEEPKAPEKSELERQMDEARAKYGSLFKK